MRIRVILAIAVIAAVVTTVLVAHHDHPRSVVATTFWVGEPANADNAYIPNNVSEWDSQWQSHFGGVDDPNHRQHNGYWPAGFKPRENPFYFALPYSEFTANGQVKANAKNIPWYDPAHPPTSSASILKNHWIRITAGSKVAYAQWEDVGPMESDDFGYVFGTARPKYKAGLDLSPATALYLGLKGQDSASWQFVNAEDVPPGPWKEIVTNSQITW